jgi:hypothetical protein
MMYFGVEVSPHQLEGWIWRSTFAEEHQSKPESYVTRLIREIQTQNVLAAMEVRKPVEPDLFAKRVRRGGSAVTIGFDLLLRKTRARSLLSGEYLAPAEGLHALLYTRAELDGDAGGRVSNAGLLANLVLLSPADATRWRELRRESTIDNLYTLCQNETGDAPNVWASQGLVAPFAVRPMAVLNARSSALLQSVISDVGRTPSPEFVHGDLA